MKEAAGALLADNKLKQKDQADQLAGKVKEAAEAVVDKARGLVTGR